MRKVEHQGNIAMAYITRRGQSWFAQVNRSGTRRSRSFRTRKAALDWADGLEAAISANANPQNDITLADLIDRYDREIGKLRPWGPAKASALRTIRKAIGCLTLPELTMQALVDFSVARSIAGAGPATITHDLSCLSPCLETARLLWGHPIPPTLIKDTRKILAHMRLSTQSRARERILLPAELARLERAWESDIPFDVIRFAVTTCMRRGEVLRIRWVDYNPTFRTVLVRDRKHPTAKIGNDQVVPLLGDACEIVERQPRRGERIFPYEAKALYRAWLAAGAAAGLKDARFHDLRHTGITDMFREGWKINEVAIVSGHQDWQTLKRYTHIVAGDLVAMEDARRAARAERANLQSSGGDVVNQKILKS